MLLLKLLFSHYGDQSGPEILLWFAGHGKKKEPLSHQAKGKKKINVQPRAKELAKGLD